MTESNNTKSALASRLRIAREQAGLSQGQAAKILKVHRPTISEIEAGRRKVSAEELNAFSGIYGVSVDWLIGSDEHNPQKDRIELAARELSKLKDNDLELVLDLLKTLRRPGDAGSK